MTERSQYEITFRAKMDSFLPGLSDDPGGVRVLEEADRMRVLAFLLGCACAAQGFEANDLGSKYLRGLPRAWTVEHIETCAADTLNLSSDWEYRRLMDIYEKIERPWTGHPTPMMDRLVARGLASPDADVREVALNTKDAAAAWPAVIICGYAKPEAKG